MKKKQTENSAKRASSLIRGRLAQKIAALCLAGAVTLPLALSLGACGRNGTGNTANPDGSDQTQQGNTGNQNQQQKPDYSQYSKLLQDILNNPEYDELYRQYESGEIGESAIGLDGGVNLLEAIPYDFLTNKGEDIESIKIGSVGVNADLYVMDNDKTHIYNKLEILYEVTGGEGYINQYLLKYKIKEDELKDFTMLYEGGYYQGPIMFQYLASQREPEVVAEFSIYEDTYKSFIKTLNSLYVIPSLLGNKVDSFVVTGLEPNADKEDYYDYDLYLNAISEDSSNSHVAKRTIAPIYLSLTSGCRVEYGNGVLHCDHTNLINFQTTTCNTITYFQLYHAFKNFKAQR